MPRPRKRRRVRSLPQNNKFGPLGSQFCQNNHIIMTVDEYETIRLIDLENYTQEQCSEQMKIGRTTIQNIYASARKKLAISLINNKVIYISGGNYELYNEFDKEV